MNKSLNKIQGWMSLFSQTGREFLHFRATKSHQINLRAENHQAEATPEMLCGKCPRCDQQEG